MTDQVKMQFQLIKCNIALNAIIDKLIVSGEAKAMIEELIEENKQLL